MGLYGTCRSSRTGHKHQKLPGGNMWPASGEHIYTDCVRNIRRQRTILYLDVRYSLKQSTSSGTIMLHWSICKDHDIEITDKWYQHEPETVTHNKDKNIRDVPVNTDRTITANRPDILIKDSVNSTCKLIDMTVPLDRNIALKEMAKKASTKT